MGPLAGLKVVEAGGIGPVPFCGMLLADMGAEVTLIERRRADEENAGRPPEAATNLRRAEIVHRGKKSIALDLKRPAGTAAAMRLATAADVLIEGFRPGVMERLGLGPEPCMAANPRLVYGRLSGWGQDGPLAQAAGHDIDYLALSGALFHGGHADAPPAAPPTLIGDLGGGAMMLATGILAALLHARKNGAGQVVDAAISDGAVLLTSLLVGLQQQGRWSDRRQANLLDGGAHWYDCYECADGGYLAVGALEPQFYREFLERCGLDEDGTFASQYDPASWPRQKEKLAALFRTRSRDEWATHFAGSDACVAPVLNLSEARRHPHHVARRAFLEADGIAQPAPAPRFGGTPGRVGGKPPTPGEHTVEILSAAGFSRADIAGLREAEAI